MKMPLNCDPCNVAGTLDQLQVDGVRIAHLTIKDGESPEDLTFTREQRSRPNGANTIRLKKVTIFLPKGGVKDVSNINRLSPIDGCAARGASWPDRRAPDVGSKPS